MYKFITIILLIIFSNSLLANNSRGVISELDLVKEFYSENIITKQQYMEHQDRLMSNTKVSTKGPGGTAIINGHLQNSLGEPIVDSLIRLYTYDPTNYNLVGGARTDVSGNYSIIDLPAGNYIAQFQETYDDYLDYIWEPTTIIVCNRLDCEIPLSSQITLVDGQVVNNIDFVPAVGGKITGNIKDAGTLLPVGTFSVTASNLVGYYNGYALVDAVTGDYSINGLPDGDFRVYLKAVNSGNFSTNLHIPQVYGGPECNTCGRLTVEGVGSVHTIALANIINNIDFSVNIGASISGSLLDSTTLNPLIEYGLVMVFNEFNRNLLYNIIYGTNIEPAADGSYILGGLLPGSYYVQGGDLGREFYQRELYNNRACYYGGCNRGSGDAVVLSAGENKIGIDFLLDKGGKISGMVTDEVTGLPIGEPSLRRNKWVEFYNDAEQVVGSSLVKDDGSYISARSLPAGNYSVRTGSMFNGNLSAPYINEKYNDIVCAGIACDLSTQDVAVIAESVTEDIDFALTTGHSFSGTITDIITGNPIPNVHVLVYKDMGAGVVKFANWATTSDGTEVGGPAVGEFEVTGLPEGTYYARTNNGSDLPFFAKRQIDVGSWIDILYSNIACPGVCDVTTGTPIVFGPLRGAGGTVIDFSLTQGATIAGQITDYAQGGAIDKITVNIYDDQGLFVSSVASDDLGNYKSKGLEAGTYYLTTSSFDVLVDVKYGNDTCIIGSCNPLDATPIILLDEESKTNINFIIKSDYLFGNQFD